MTQQELREYEWEKGQMLVDESTTADDLLRHNRNIDHLHERTRDDDIDRMVRGLADKIRNNQNVSGAFRFALHLHGRVFPPKIRNGAAQAIMAKYGEE